MIRLTFNLCRSLNVHCRYSVLCTYKPVYVFAKISKKKQELVEKKKEKQALNLDTTIDLTITED